VEFALDGNGCGQGENAGAGVSGVRGASGVSDDRLVPTGGHARSTAA
jgi:hypothetical protein